jgi:hypothetical protein
MTNNLKPGWHPTGMSSGQLNVEAIPRLKGIRNPAWAGQCEVRDSSRKGAAATQDPVKSAQGPGHCRFCC